MWPFKPKPRPIATHQARLAMGISSPVMTVDEMTEALKPHMTMPPDAWVETVAAGEPSTTIVERIDSFMQDAATEAEANRSDLPKPGSPEYHHNIAGQMLEQLKAKVIRLDTEIDTLTDTHAADMKERQQAYQDRLAELQGEVAGVRLSVKGYEALTAVLAPAYQTGEAPADHVAPPKPSRKSRPIRRDTFVIPNGHVAILDAEGRATGETRPINPATE